MNIQRRGISASIGLGISVLASAAFAAPPSCSSLPSWAALKSALQGAVAASNGGLGFNMWATVVANDGTVCAVAFSGNQYTDQWLASRVISAQKANTANGLSLSNGATPGTSLFGTAGLALSTANLYSAVQPGGSLYGLQHSNPVDAELAYRGPAVLFGTTQDPLVGSRVGGVNVFGGGLGLYAEGGKKVGAIGVSGDTSCTDHFVAWRVRNTVLLDHLGTLGHLGANDAQHPDNIIFDITETDQGGLLNPVGKLSKSASGFGHPTCINTADPATLPAVQNP